MKKVVLWLAGGILCALFFAYIYFSDKEYVVTIPEQVIREKLDSKLPLKKTYLLIFDVTLDNPRVDLIAGSNRINTGLDIELNIKIDNHEKPLGGKVDASGDLRYAPSEGAFYLVNPVIENLLIQGLPENYSDKISKVFEKALKNFYSSRPIYTLKASDTKPAAARLILKTLQIQEEAVIVTLGI